MDKLVTYSDSDSDSDDESEIIVDSRKSEATQPENNVVKSENYCKVLNDKGISEKCGEVKVKVDNNRLRTENDNINITNENKRKADDECRSNIVIKKSKETNLPLPDSIRTLFQGQQIHEDDPSKHDGKIRSFPHMEGNWATHLYIPYEADEEFLDLINQLFLCLQPLEFQLMKEFHLSLSRTVYIRHHWIQLLTQSISNKLQPLSSCYCVLKCIKLYTNDEKTRTFLAVQIETNSDLLKYTEAIDVSFKEFKLQPYYEEPSYHISIGWCLGDVVKQIKEDKMNKLEQILTDHLKTYPDMETFFASKIECKTGNKNYCFPLKAIY